MMGGNDANDPWGMREEPDEIQGLGNMEIRQQQQHIIRGSLKFEVLKFRTLFTFCSQRNCVLAGLEFTKYVPE